MQQDQQNMDSGNKRNQIKTSLISVIVPIYNVEKYVRKCLDSLLAQTFFDVEFICIDDGSTDGSGMITDEYRNDRRFRIFHTINQGLSAARNFGIDKSCGEWIMFVDGDDYVDQKFCEIAYNACIAYDADLVIFQANKDENGDIKPFNSVIGPTGIIDSFTAIEFGEYAAWNKMYKRKLFDVIRFPNGRIYEEIATIHKVILRARKIVHISNLLYTYVIRKDSISHVFSSDNMKEHFISVRERYNDLVLYGFPENIIKDELCAAAIGYLSRTIPSNDTIYKEAAIIADSYRGEKRKFTSKQKIGLIIWQINKHLFYFISRATGRIKTS